MVEIPENEVTQNDLAEWYRTNEELARLKSKELMLRNKIFKGKFPTPEEGVNTVPINDGTGAVLKGTYVINRTVDEAALTTVSPLLIEEQIPVGDLIKWKPELVIRAYRTLTAEQRQKFDQVLIIKPGQPQLKIEIPKKRSTK